MKNPDIYRLIQQILKEQSTENDDEESGVDPALKKIQDKAQEIRAKASLLRSQNQLTRAEIDKKELDKEIQQDKKKQQAKVKTVHRSQKDEDLNSGNPIEEPIEETAYSPEENDDLARLAPGNEPNVTEQGEDDPEDEDVPENNITDEEDEEDVPTVLIAGEEPQTKDEAEIARIQAQTREVQSKIGEYTPPGAGNAEDAAAGDEMDTGGDIDPATGMPIDPSGMGGDIDPMTGMPITPKEKDPMAGFGDTTDPAAAGGMGGFGMGGMGGAIDPMTGMPTDDDSASKTPTAIGRLYTLKKIYYRLALLDQILTNCPDTEISDLAAVTKEAFSIFQIIIQNLKSYKDKVDELIIDYYMLVRDITKQLEQHFKQKSLEAE